MRVEEEYEKTGYFWLPEQDDKKIPGILTIKDGGDIELEVVGVFGENLNAFGDDLNLGRIIGHVEKDGLVTLEGCFYTKKNIPFGGISKSKVCVNMVLSGAAYDECEELEFETFSFSVDCLDEWVGITGIKVDSDWKNRAATIIYNLPENIILNLDGGVDLEICFACTFPGLPNTTEAKITQRVYFKIKSAWARPLSDYTSLAHKITNFMCFAIDATVSMKSVSATSKKIQRELTEGTVSPVPIRIYYPSIPYAESVPRKSWHRMLFSYGAIKTNAQNIFKNWLSAYEEISPALSLYFSTKVGAQKYLDGKFLALAQGLETYHRRTSSEKLMDAGDFDDLVVKIIKNCPEEHREWLKGRLMHGNEINLGKRIKRIIDPFKELLGNSKERSKLLRTIVDTRNYLTHYNNDLKDKAASGKDLWRLCLKMEVIFQLHFLKVIGFNDLEVNSVVENSYPMKQKLNEI